MCQYRSCLQPVSRSQRVSFAATLALLALMPKRGHTPVQWAASAEAWSASSTPPYPSGAGLATGGPPNVQAQAVALIQVRTRPLTQLTRELEPYSSKNFEADETVRLDHPRMHVRVVKIPLAGTTTLSRDGGPDDRLDLNPRPNEPDSGAMRTSLRALA